MPTEKKIRKNVPAWRGRYFGLEDALYDKITDVSNSLGVSKAHVINEAIKQGLSKAIDQIKYG